MSDLYWITETSIDRAGLRESATSSGDGNNCGCDVSTNVDGICIHNCSCRTVINTDRVLEEADSSIQSFYQSQSGLYRADLVLALSMALGRAFDQSLDHWRPLVVSSLPNCPNAWYSECFLSMD